MNTVMSSEGYSGRLEERFLKYRDMRENARSLDARSCAKESKKALDAQFRTQSDLQAVLNYLEILQLAGLIEK